MQKQENTKRSKILNLQTCTKDRNEKQKRKIDARYRCAMSGNRLAGFCEVLIHDNIYNRAELFHLYFSPNGILKHQYLAQEEVAMWKYHKIDMRFITYQQALVLLGDALRRNYSDQIKDEWLQNNDSLHIQRIWKKEYYDCNNCSINWLLDLQDPIQFVTVYLNAISNKDAVLLYDVAAKQMKQCVSRDVYAYSWNHVLEEIDISQYEIKYIKQNAEGAGWDIYVEIYGGYETTDMLTVDLCLKLILENEGLRLLHEYVMDANYISNSDL